MPKNLNLTESDRNSESSSPSWRTIGAHTLDKQRRNEDDTSFMPDESDDEEDQLEDDEYNTETPNATMRPMAVRHSGPPAGVPTNHDLDDYDSEVPSSRRKNDPNEIVKVTMLQKLALVGLRMRRLPWLTLGEILARKGIRLRMWPHTLEFPGEFKYAGKGISSIPKSAARLLLASLHDEMRPIIFEVVDANTHK
ncbi:hypothetical protein DXG01_012185, partial [Tephrocybe rancida]